MCNYFEKEKLNGGLIISVIKVLEHTNFACQVNKHFLVHTHKEKFQLHSVTEEELKLVTCGKNRDSDKRVRMLEIQFMKTQFGNMLTGINIEKNTL